VLVVVPDGGEELRDVIVVESVAHPPSVALSYDESELTQDAQLLRDGTGFHLDDLGEFFDTPLLVQ